MARHFKSILAWKREGSPEALGAATNDRAFLDEMIPVSLAARFVACRFQRCTFLWGRRDRIVWQLNIFLNCIFENCDLGMSEQEFRNLTIGAVFVLNQNPMLQKFALDLAVREVREQRPFLVQMSLGPSNAKIRDHVADLVRVEYQKIIGEIGIRST